MGNQSSFSGAKLKMQWAKRNHEALADSIGKYWKNNTDPICIRTNVETGQKHACINLPEFSNWWPLCIGDVIHNLRSSLDHLAVEAAIANKQPSNTVSSGTYFPITTDANAFKPKGDAAKKIKHLNDAHKKIVEAYNLKDGGNRLLRDLHILDIRDKHRMLVPAAAALVSNNTMLILPQNHDGSFDGAAEMTMGHVSKFPLKNGDRIASYPIDQPDHHIRPDVTMAIAFGEGQPLEGEPVLETLTRLGELVSEIIRAFEADS
ncbi:MAG: hypothetical protein AAGA89_05415 [Pseudomonadota bacterium]